jgi:hypothetical protein
MPTRNVAGCHCLPSSTPVGDVSFVRRGKAVALQSGNLIRDARFSTIRPPTASTFARAFRRLGTLRVIRGDQCGRNVFPVSSSVFNRERIRGQPSAFCRYAGSSSAHSSFVTTTFTASVS